MTAVAERTKWIKYFSPDGRELTLREWVVVTTDERTVAKTEIAPGLRLHTLWFGRDFGTQENPKPCRYESLLFNEADEDADGDTVGEWECLEDAASGHATLVRALRIAVGKEMEGDIQ